MKRLTVLLSLSVVSLTALGDGLTLEKLRTKLARSQADWVAGETNVSRLPSDDRRRLLGAELPEGFQDYFVPRQESPQRGLRAELDWRNKDGVNYASPVLNQGRCGSCVAFAVVATLETQANITRKTPSSPWAFSPQHLFSCGGGSCERGWQPSSAASYLKSKGVPDEACFPYGSGAKGEDIACSNSCGDSAARSTKITGYTTPTFFLASVDAVKKALQSGPLVTTMMVYEDFLYYKGGVYKHVTGEMQGGHAVSIVGYSDSDRAWIVRNSWGEDWGEKGYVRVAWDDSSGVGRQTWQLQVPATEGYVTLGSLRDRDVLRGTVTLKPDVTFQGTHAVELIVRKRGGGRHWFPLAPGAALELDTTQFEDGVYTATAVVRHSGGTATSQPRTVHILNGNLSGMLKLTNVTAGQVFKGSQVFEMDVQSSPVPFSRVVFKARNVATGEEIVRGTPNVAAKMAINWRLKDASNGEYDLVLEGHAGEGNVISSDPVRVKVAN